MKYHYIFVDTNNNHENTYHPFITSKEVTQEKANELMNTIPGAGRMGTNVNQLMQLLNLNNIRAEPYFCPCCDNLIGNIPDGNVSNWDFLTNKSWKFIECITGNY